VAVATFAAALGEEPRLEAGAWVWNVGGRPRPVVVVPESEFVACTTSTEAVADPGVAAACVLGRPGPAAGDRAGAVGG
jgi:hypothetical protein